MGIESAIDLCGVLPCTNRRGLQHVSYMKRRGCRLLCIFQLDLWRRIAVSTEPLLFVALIACESKNRGQEGRIKQN